MIRLSGSVIGRILLTLSLGAFSSLPREGLAQNGPGGPEQPGSQNGGQKEKKRFPDFNKVVEGAQKIGGLFTLYHNKEEGKVFAEIKASQFNKPFLAPMAIAKGLGMAGHPLHQMDQWVLMFRRSGDNLQIIRRNIRYEAPKGKPIAKAVEQNFTDSIIMAIPIRSVKGSTVLIDLSDIFFRNFAQLGLGGLDRSRTSWHKIKAFENNIELEVEATFRGGGFSLFGLGTSGVIDSRGITVVIHYSLARLQNRGYQPRLADNRVGHFLNAAKDYGKEDPDTYFVRRINRWHLEKANPQAPVSPPKEKIIWWVEGTVPYRFRPYVEEGILEWNKAFEEIGFKNPIEVRWQGANDDFEPENIDYCTFKWLTSGSTYAMSGIRANPLTGEIVDGDVVFDASWIKYWKTQFAYFVHGSTVSGEGGPRFQMPLAKGEVISPIQAVEEGFGLPFPLPETRRKIAAIEENGHQKVPELVPSDWNPIRMKLRRQMANQGGQYALCQYNAFQSYQLALAAMALGMDESGDEDADDEGDDKNGEDGDEGKKDEEKEQQKKQEELLTKFLGQAIKMVVMHEVGHSLGLRHNFKASTIRKNKELHKVKGGRENALVGSVMDYIPANIAVDREKQGDYYPASIGPYDYWAIEYAYKPVRGNEQKALNEIASRSPEPDLVYATDEDLYGTHDPYVNTYDLGADPVAYGNHRMKLAGKLMKDLDERLIEKGESWARLRDAFSILLGQYGDAASLTSDFIGGQRVHRDHKGPEGRDPIVPISGKKQKQALDVLVQRILSEDAFEFSPELLRRLTTERWYHWGSGSSYLGGGVSYPIYERILSIQRIALSHCLDGSMLKRLQNQQLMRGRDEESPEIADVFRVITDGIWSELAMSEDDEADDETLELSTIRRNLQREHLERLSRIVLGPGQSSYYSLYTFVSFSSGSSYPPDAKSLARMHLREIRDRIKKVLKSDEVEVGETTRAHLMEVRERISKVLEAGVEVSQAW